LVLCRALGDRQGTGTALLILGQLASLQDQHTDARVRNEEGLVLFRGNCSELRNIAEAAGEAGPCTLGVGLVA
jgi:hypothetical protein